MKGGLKGGWGVDFQKKKRDSKEGLLQGLVGWLVSRPPRQNEKIEFARLDSYFALNGTRYTKRPSFNEDSLNNEVTWRGGLCGRR